MINHEHKCVFIHQRKCAGSSIKKAFGADKRSLDRDMFKDGSLSISPPWSVKHQDFDDYFTFAVIRNPFDRFISGWHYLDARHRRSRTIDELLEDLPLKGHGYFHLTRCQHEILCDANGALVVDFLVRFEHLQHDFNRVCDLIGKPRIRLPHRKQGARRHYLWYFLRSRHRRAIRERYADDFVLWRFAEQLNQGCEAARRDGRTGASAPGNGYSRARWSSQGL